MRIVLLILLMSLPSWAVPVTLDGKELDVPSTVQNGRTMVELRTLAEQLGWQLEYRDGRAIISTSKRQAVSATKPIPSKETFGPENGSIIYNLRPEISARFTTLLDPNAPFKLLVNGSDLSSQATLQRNEVRWLPNRQIGAGLHKVKLTVVNKAGETLTREWSFQVKNRLSH